MKRILRVVMVVVLFLLGGAVVTTLVAEGIGCSGMALFGASGRNHFVDIGGKVAVVWDVRGPGWRFLDWIIVDKDYGAGMHRIYEEHLSRDDQSTGGTVPHAEPLEALPPWGRFQRPEDWPANTQIKGSYLYASGEDIAAGWPFLSFSMGDEPNAQVGRRGGMSLKVTSAGHRRALFWRPLLPGFLLDSLIWASCLALMAWLIRALIVQRRKKRGRCPSCGYDLRGLPAPTPCPECGRTRTGAAAVVG